MKRITQILLVLGVFLMVGCSKGEKQYSIELESNATTGYAWEYTISKETIAKVVKNEYIEPENTEGMVGVPGKQLFVFEGLKEGEVEIHFIYKRPWEETPSLGGEGLVYKLKVDKDLNITLVSKEKMD